MDAGDPVLFVVRGLDPVGTGRQVELAAEGFAAAGRRVEIAVTSLGGGVAERLAVRGFPVHRLGRRPEGDVAASLRLLGLVRRLRPATLVGFGRSQAARVALARSLSGCRGIAWLGLPPRGAGQAAALRLLDLVVAGGPPVADACRRAGVAGGRVAVVPPAAAADPGRGLSRPEIAMRLGLDPAKRWTLAVAPFEPAARLARLLWAIDQLGVVRKDLQHVLVGSGPLLGAIRRLARRQEIAERLFITRHCGVLPDLVRETALVWQSGEVALGGALLDGMAAGVPAVAVAGAAAGQLVVDGGTGRLVAAVPESELPRRAFGILEDQALADRYGRTAAARAAEDFPVERFVAGLLAAVG